MVWARLDDKSAFHPKVIKAGNEAWGALCRMVAYCSDQLTDGIVPAEVAAAIAGDKRVIKRLLSAGLLGRHSDGYSEPDADGDGGPMAAFVVHDYLDWNDSREQVMAARARASAAGKKGAEKRWGNSARYNKANGPAMAPSTVGYDAPTPTPTPNRSPNGDPRARAREAPPGKSKKSRRKSATSLPPDWKPNDAAMRFCGEHRLSVTWEAANFREWTSAKDARYANWDAAFMNHLRRRAEDPRRQQGAPAGLPQVPLPEPAERLASSALPPAKDAGDAG